MEQNNSNILPEVPLDIGDSKAQEDMLFLPDDEWMDVDIGGSLLNLDDELETPEYTIELNGARMAPVTGVQTIAGQSGHGKTQLMTLLMSAYLGATIEGIRNIWEKQQPRVLYVDTEMEKGNTQLVVARVARLCNVKIAELKSRLFVMRLRDEEDHANIWRKILKATFELKPDVLFLDGMIDIIGDFNDNKEASSIIRKVMKMADHYLMPIWAVMHQNPGTKKMAGHEGSFLERKSTAVLSPEKICDNEEEGIYHFEIKNGKQRGEDIKPLRFHMAIFELPNGKKNAYPVTGTSQAYTKPADDEQQMLKAFFRTLNFPANGKSWTELDNDMRLQGGITSKRKREQMLADAQTFKFVEKANKRYYFHENCGNAEQKDMFEKAAEIGEVDGL